MNTNLLITLIFTLTFVFGVETTPDLSANGGFCYGLGHGYGNGKGPNMQWQQSAPDHQKYTSRQQERT